MILIRTDDAYSVNMCKLREMTSQADVDDQRIMDACDAALRANYETSTDRFKAAFPIEDSSGHATKPPLSRAARRDRLLGV